MSSFAPGMILGHTIVYIFSSMAHAATLLKRPGDGLLKVHCQSKLALPGCRYITTYGSCHSSFKPSTELNQTI